MTIEPLTLRPRRLSREYRTRPLAEGYGERKRAREAAKIPLLAADWLRVLRWRRTATLDQRRTFASRWAHLPHTPEYALYLIRSLQNERA